MMWCAECGDAMTRNDNGTWNSHCFNLGYWTKDAPLKDDSWWPIMKSNGYCFYPTVNWPKHKKPRSPNETD